MAKIIEQSDKLGRPVVAGNFVAFAHHNDLRVGVVTKVCPKLIMITEIDRERNRHYRKYQFDLIVMEESPLVTMYCLKHGK